MAPELIKCPICERSQAVMLRRNGKYICMDCYNKFLGQLPLIGVKECYGDNCRICAWKYKGACSEWNGWHGNGGIK